MGAAGVGLVPVRRRLRGRGGARHDTTATINAMTSIVRMIRRSILCCPVLHFVCLGLAMESVNVLRPRVDAVPVLHPKIRHIGRVWLDEGRFFTTQGLHRWRSQDPDSRPPSLCLLQQSGRCFAGERCNQMHLHAEDDRWLQGVVSELYDAEQGMFLRHTLTRTTAARCTETRRMGSCRRCIKWCSIIDDMNGWFRGIGWRGPAIGLIWTSHSSTGRVRSPRIAAWFAIAI